MAKQQKGGGKMRISAHSGEGWGGIGRFLCTVIILILILMVTLFFLVRTEGAKDIVQSRLERATGLEMQVASVRIGWPYVLVIKNVQSSEFGPQQAGMKAQEIRVGLGVSRPIVRVALHRPVIHLVSAGGRHWTPASVTRLGGLPARNISEITTVTSRLRHRVRLRVSDGAIVWLSEAGEEMAVATGVGFRMQPIRVPGRMMHFYQLSAYGVEGVGNEPVHNIEREWLASDTMDYIELYRAGGTLPPFGGVFWEVAAGDEPEPDSAQESSEDVVDAPDAAEGDDTEGGGQE